VSYCHLNAYHLPAVRTGFTLEKAFFKSLITLATLLEPPAIRLNLGQNLYFALITISSTLLLIVAIGRIKL